MHRAAGCAEFVRDAHRADARGAHGTFPCNNTVLVHAHIALRAHRSGIWPACTVQHAVCSSLLLKKDSIMVAGQVVVQ